MKILKLNRRYKNFKEHGHTVGLRFSAWNEQAINTEKVMREITGCGGWWPENGWSGNFGTARNKHGVRPYFITMRDENLLSMVLLKIQ